MRALVVLLLSGAPALAQAQPTSALPPAQQPPVLTAFAINEGDAVAPAGVPLRLSHTVVGTAPAAFRVSTRADFVGADWLPYRRVVELPLSAFPTAQGCSTNRSSRQVRLFLQVRALFGNEVRIVNGVRTVVPLMAESNVMVDSICVSDSPRR